MTPGTRVRTPDGRTGTITDRPTDRLAWVECDQVSNVNRLELFAVKWLEVIE